MNLCSGRTCAVSACRAHQFFLCPSFHSRSLWLGLVLLCLWPLPPPQCAVLGFASHIKHIFVRRAQDYWVGYKLFCYSYYSHSPQHVVEFRESKLGASISSPLVFSCVFCRLQFRLDFGFWVVGEFALPTPLPALLQGNSSGVAMLHAPPPPHMQSVPPAWNFSLSWRCSAGGSYWRTATTCKGS